MRVTRLLYLDTSHISQIARDPHSTDSKAVLRLLQPGNVELGISIMHALEFSSPTFRSFDSVRDFLRDVPLRMAIERSNAIDDEIGYVASRVTGGMRRPPRVFVRDLGDWGLKTTIPSGYGPIDILDHLKQDQSERDRGIAVAEHGATLSALKENAAVARDPEAIAALYVCDHLESIRRTSPNYVDAETPEGLIVRAGGVVAFPMLSAMLSIARERLIYPGKKTKANDIIDEYHVSYSPYASVTTVDGPTFTRYRNAKVAYMERVTPHLAAVPDILERIERGELHVEPSA